MLNDLDKYMPKKEDQFESLIKATDEEMQEAERQAITNMREAQAASIRKSKELEDMIRELITRLANAETQIKTLQAMNIVQLGPSADLGDVKDTVNKIVNVMNQGVSNND